MSSSQSEEQTMFFTRKKKKEWYDQSEATEVCEVRLKISAFYRHLLLAAPLLSELLRRHSMREVSLEEFFS